MTSMMRARTTKHVLLAGALALGLLATPVGVAFQWGDTGPTLTAESIVSTAYAAPSRPTTKKPPTGGMPTFTSSGTTQKTTGFQTPGGTFSDKQCQAVADAYDGMLADAATENANGPTTRGLRLELEAESLLLAGMEKGCGFTGPVIPD